MSGEKVEPPVRSDAVVEGRAMPAGEGGGERHGALKRALRGMSFAEGEAALAPDVQAKGDPSKKAKPKDPSKDKDPSDATVEMVEINGTLWATDADGNALPPSLEDVQQGGLNDCYLMAALAGMVHADPTMVEDRITDHGDGTYTVSFAGIIADGEATTVTVDGTEFEKGRHAIVGGRAALWPLIVEKAYGMVQGGMDKLDEGGVPGDAAEDLTNKGTSTVVPSTMSDKDVLAKLESGKKHKWIMTISSPSKKSEATKEQHQLVKELGFVYWHIYTVIDVDANGQRVKLFNPWGSDHPGKAEDGWISIDDFKTWAADLQINA